MRRIAIALLLGLVLSMLLGTSVVSAGAPPDAILIDPDNPDHRVVITKDDVKDGVPDILIKTPHGPKPKDGVPR